MHSIMTEKYHRFEIDVQNIKRIVYFFLIYLWFIHTHVGVLVHPAFIYINRTKAVLTDHLHKKDEWNKNKK